jgi:SAM-dependent methyltransferase
VSACGRLVRHPLVEHWFEGVAEHLGGAYLRYSFTKGTEQEVGFLVEALGLAPGMRVLDVGCGPGRHAHALARAGCEVVGVDISQRFVDLASRDAPPGATFRRLDARALPFESEFDAAISLCQGAFGLAGGPGGPGSPAAAGGAAGAAASPAASAPPGPPLDTRDAEVLDGIARALRPGGVAAVSAFSAYFMVRWLEETDTFDAATGVNHEKTTIRDEAGTEVPTDLWTTCFTPRELRLLAARAGLEVRAVWSVTPGDYAARPPTIDTPELLLVAARGA